MHGGVSINPETPIDDILNLRSGHCDIVDILAVEPGFGGQLFQESAIQKIEELYQWIDKLAGGGGRGHTCKAKIQIMVDGGINKQTLPRVKKARLQAREMVI